MSSQSSSDNQLWAELESDQTSRKIELCTFAVNSTNQELKTLSQNLYLTAKRLEILGLELAFGRNYGSIHAYPELLERK